MRDRISKIGESDSISRPSANAISRKVTTIKINSTDLCKQLVFIAQPVEKFQVSIPQIESVVFRASGRVISSQTWNDSKFAALTSQPNSSAPGSYEIVDGGCNVTDKEIFSPAAQALTLNFSDMSLFSNQWTNGIALSGLSSMSCEITCKCRNNAEFVVSCYSVTAGIVSISTSTGAIVFSNSIKIIYV